MAYRQTKQRDEVLQAIKGIDCHLTAEEVYQEVVKSNPNIGVATVYRNLKHLVETKHISRIVDKGISYYDGNNMPHYHVRCIKCEKYHDAPIEYMAKQDDLLREEHNLAIIGHNITFDYVCDTCNHLKDKN